MKPLLLCVLVFTFAVSSFATPLTFVIDPSQTGTVFPTGRIDFFSSELNGMELDGRHMSLDIGFSDNEMARIFLLNPIRFYVLLGISTDAPSYPGFAGDTSSGYLKDTDGRQIGDTQMAGRGMANNGMFGVGLSPFMSADSGGSQVADIGGAHIDLEVPNSGYRITNANLRFSLYGNPTEVGTATQIPEAPSWMFLPIGLAGIHLARRFARVKSRSTV